MDSHSFLLDSVHARTSQGLLDTGPGVHAEVSGRTCRVPGSGSTTQEVDGELSISRFADGEMEAEIGTSVRGCDVFLFPGGGTKRGRDIIVEENKIETYHAVDALRRAQAGRITVFEPYCSPGRSDRLTRRNSVGLWLHFKILISLGIDHYITFQLHSDKSKTFIDPAVCVGGRHPRPFPVEDVRRGQFHQDAGSASTPRSVNNWLFCSVDAGGEALAKKFAASFGTRIVISPQAAGLHRRPTRWNPSASSPRTPIEGKTLWIIDDMIDTGDSMCKLVRELARRSPASINIAIVHPCSLRPPWSGSASCATRS